ncbi:hypothetical protein [Paraliomyxa miuraensis]|uniref:hypothetical protein n=1 Tax=Paraliomyxa miuraensis TaxID=376150 RepID=UPI002253B09D|nr:hypothetical protein [Paraliomyxa miuraensis]MCX4239553.1 hypothetical protein [Paraliomyxa miuraensis]
MSLGPALPAAQAGGLDLLRMRGEPSVEEDPAGRAYAGPTAVADEPGRVAPWNDPNQKKTEVEAGDAEPDGAAVGVHPEGGAMDDAPSAAHEGPTQGAASADGGVTATVPPPSSVRDVPEHVTVAVGLAPEAPGTRDEKGLLDALESNARASTDPTTDVRRLRPGAGAPRQTCREQRDDLVVVIGYVADRQAPVVLAHDCRLDRALSVRAADAAHSSGLVSALWDEHQQLLREGVRERRRLSVGPKARAGIIGGVAFVVVGVAVGALVANALREESVVITVRP